MKKVVLLLLSLISLSCVQQKTARQITEERLSKLSGCYKLSFERSLDSLDFTNAFAMSLAQILFNANVCFNKNNEMITKINMFGHSEIIKSNYSLIDEKTVLLKTVNKKTNKLELDTIYIHKLDDDLNDIIVSSKKDDYMIDKEFKLVLTRL